MASLAMKTLTVASVIYLFPKVPLLAFAAGQLAYGISVLASLAAFFSLSSKPVGLGVWGCLLAMTGCGGVRQARGGFFGGYDTELVRLVPWSEISEVLRVVGAICTM
jgi:hypothetical protein